MDAGDCIGGGADDGATVMSRFPETRWSLIRRLDAEGGTAAVLLVEAYADAVARYLRSRLGDLGPTCDDITQDVLAHLLERPDLLARATPQPGLRFRHYLMRLAWNEARNALRRSRRGEGQDLHEDSLAAADTLDPHMDAAWAASVLAQAWQELRARGDAGDVDASVVAVTEAHLREGVGLRDLAARGLGSLATCSRRLAQGRMLLQQAIVERLRQAGELGADESPAAACDRLLETMR